MQKKVYLTSTQHGVWITINELLSKQKFVTVKDIVNFHKFTPRNALKYLKLFEVKGLLTSRKVKRKWIFKPSKKALIVSDNQFVKVSILRETWEKIVQAAREKGISKQQMFNWILEKITE